MADQDVINTNFGGIKTRYKDVGGGYHAAEVTLAPGASVATTSAPTSVTELWSDGTLVAGLASVTSAWINVTNYDSLRIGRTSTGGTYAFEIDWGRANGTADFTEVITVANNATIDKPNSATWARFRVRNTDTVTAFSAHRTNIFGR